MSAVVLLIDMTAMRKGQERTENGQDNATVPEDNGTGRVKEREGVMVVRSTGMVACFVQPAPIRSMPAALMRVAGGCFRQQTCGASPLQSQSEAGSQLNSVRLSQRARAEWLGNCCWAS